MSSNFEIPTYTTLILINSEGNHVVQHSQQSEVVNYRNYIHLWYFKQVFEHTWLILHHFWNTPFSALSVTLTTILLLLVIMVFLQKLQHALREISDTSIERIGGIPEHLYQPLLEWILSLCRGCLNIYRKGRESNHQG